ncbi:osmotically-inducible lipoprotein B [Paracoccus litorisediminis]|uniref:hypothetical protein n=1 Tax=Paracoccus litorisediminis TaxID=2006130 RepID=UPI003734AA64
MNRTISTATAIAIALTAALSGCTQNIQPTELDRAIIGAGTGALIADLSGKSVLGGAALGATAGALCNDVKLCQ